MCAICQFLFISQKRRGLLGFSPESICNLRIIVAFCYSFVSVWGQLWAWNMSWYWPHAVRSWNVCEKTCLGVYLEPARSEKNEKKKFVPAETPDCWWPFCRPVVGRDTISPLAPALLNTSTKELARSPRSPSSKLMAVSTVWYEICDICVGIASGIRGWQSLGRLPWTSSYLCTDWHSYLTFLAEEQKYTRGR